MLDLYGSWGYQFVITPLIEYLDSLLVGSSHDLDLHTFKITDQLSGRMMGIRADITPQVARIDAHCLNREGPARLCYADSVLHTKPRGLTTSRVPIRIGAELYGHSGIECDVELICLMYESLSLVEIGNIHIVLGHVGIFRTLIQESGINSETEKLLFEAVQRKAYEEIDALLEKSVLDKNLQQMLHQLSRLSGDEDTLATALEVFKSAPASVKSELEELEAIANGVKQRLPEVVLCYDLCELTGYEYHTGIVFAAYTPDYGRVVAKGGRYDDIGLVFGRARPASGFDSDLKTLARLTKKSFAMKSAICAPDKADQDLIELINTLRSEGECVVVNFAESGLDEEAAKELNCDRQIVKRDGGWVVENI